MHRLSIFIICLSVLLFISKSVSGTKCGPVCEIYCEYGNILDANGCPTCKCRLTPAEPKRRCTGGQAPLEGYNCGRSSAHRDCPTTHQCVIARNDAYAICCPRRR
jgi:hypothetical protein